MLHDTCCHLGAYQWFSAVAPMLALWYCASLTSLTSEQDTHTHKLQKHRALCAPRFLIPYVSLLSEKHHAHLAEGSGTATITLVGLGNTIDDAEFFPDLPGLVNGVADRLTRLMYLDKRLISALHKACTACPMLLAFHGCCQAVFDAIQSLCSMARSACTHKADTAVGLVQQSVPVLSLCFAEAKLVHRCEHINKCSDFLRLYLAQSTAVHDYAAIRARLME